MMPYPLAPQRPPIFMIQIDLKGLSESPGSTSDAAAAGRDHLLGRFLNKIGNRRQKF